MLAGQVARVDFGRVFRLMPVGQVDQVDVGWGIGGSIWVKMTGPNLPSKTGVS